MELFPLQKFPRQTFDKVRYADTDRQGHVNNAAFSTFLETGRVELLYNPELPILSAGASFVIASLHLDFLREITWPGRVEIGTGIASIGTSSIRILQQIFQHEACAARAETVIVHVSNETRRGTPLSPQARQTLQSWLLDAPA